MVCTSILPRRAILPVIHRDSPVVSFLRCNPDPGESLNHCLCHERRMARRGDKGFVQKGETRRRKLCCAKLFMQKYKCNFCKNRILPRAGGWPRRTPPGGGTYGGVFDSFTIVNFDPRFPVEKQVFHFDPRKTGVRPPIPDGSGSGRV